MTIDCVICLHPAKDELVLACQHHFCRTCILPWLEVNNKCPMCSQVIGEVSRNTLEHNNEEADHPPCVDHLYPERNQLQMKLLSLNSRIQTKREASVKACISKAVLSDLKNRQQDLEELFQLFCLLLDQAGSISEAVALMETINFGILEIEELLEGRRSSPVNSPQQTPYEEYISCQYEDDFPEMEVRQPKTSKKRNDKSKFAQQNKKFVK